MIRMSVEWVLGVSCHGHEEINPEKNEFAGLPMREGSSIQLLVSDADRHRLARVPSCMSIGAKVSQRACSHAVRKVPQGGRYHMPREGVNAWACMALNPQGLRHGEPGENDFGGPLVPAALEQRGSQILVPRVPVPRQARGCAPPRVPAASLGAEERAATRVAVVIAAVSAIPLESLSRPLSAIALHGERRNGWHTKTETQPSGGEAETRHSHTSKRHRNRK